LPIPDPDDGGVVQVVSGNGFQIVDDPSQRAPGDRGTPTHNLDPIEYRNSPQRKASLPEWKSKGVQGAYRTFDEDRDAADNKMRMLGIWEAHEIMERGVGEKDNPSTFLA
jgi:hypothetical protein